MKQTIHPPLVLFDGVCGLCNGAVHFLIRHDKKEVLQFASLQSDVAQPLLQRHGHLKKLDSIVLIEGGKIFQKSIAALKLVKYLPWYWRWLQVAWLVPWPLRNAAYDFIARHRYRWFGKKELCPLPPPEIKKRFLT